MTSNYVKEAAIVSAMASELRPLPSLEDRGAARMTLTAAGFRTKEIDAFLDRAINNERLRRIAFSKPLMFAS